MSISKKELAAWIEKLPEGSIIGIDDGGLTLETDSGSSLEIGGLPMDEQKFVDR